jgi:hypothetical protein
MKVSHETNRHRYGDEYRWVSLAAIASADTLILRDGARASPAEW